MSYVNWWLFYKIKLFDILNIKKFCSFIDVYFFKVMSTFHGFAHSLRNVDPFHSRWLLNQSFVKIMNVFFYYINITSYFIYNTENVEKIFKKWCKICLNKKKKRRTGVHGWVVWNCTIFCGWTLSYSYCALCIEWNV